MAAAAAAAAQRIERHGDLGARACVGRRAGGGSALGAGSAAGVACPKVVSQAARSVSEANGNSARPRSFTEANRVTGSRRRARSTTASSPGGTSGCSARGGRGSPAAMACSTPSSCCRRRGARPSGTRRRSRPGRTGRWPGPPRRCSRPARGRGSRASRRGPLPVTVLLGAPGIVGARELDPLGDRDSEVEDLRSDRVACREEDVERLEVAMGDLRLMRRRDRATNRDQDVRDLLGRQRAPRSPAAARDPRRSGAPSPDRCSGRHPPPRTRQRCWDDARAWRSAPRAENLSRAWRMLASRRSSTLIATRSPVSLCIPT